MKLTFILMITFVIATSAGTSAQNISLDVHDATLKQVFNEIKKQNGYEFLYNSSMLKDAKKVTVNANNAPINEVLDKCFEDQPVTYTMDGKTIIVVERNKPVAVKMPLAAFKVTGTVKDEKGNTMPGVTIRVKGTNIATSTDNNGAFTINAPGDNAVLDFSSIGYESLELAIGSSHTINVILKEKNGVMNEVVVVAYGTQKKATLTGAIATMSTKDLVQSPVANISNSLVGRLPGLFASQGSGEPGADQSKLRIRGLSTFSGNTDPLIMVDGFATSNFNNIDPNEIESVSILKDASATAVYGIRGANGVVLVTTRRGKTGPPVFSYSVNQAINSFTALPQPMDAATYAADFNLALANDAYASNSVYVPRYSANDIQLYQNGTDPVFHPNINWYNALLNKYSYQQTHNLNVRGGTEKVRYFLSAGYLNQSGLFKDFSSLAGFNSNLDYNRFNLRSNFDFQINKRLKITIDASTQNEQRTGNNQNTSNEIDNLGRANPVDADVVVDGKIVNNVSGASNPLQTLLQQGYKNQYSNFLDAKIRIDHKLDFITKGLDVFANVDYQNFNGITYNTANNNVLIIYTATQLPNGTINYIPSQDPGAYGFNTSQSKNRTESLEGGFNYSRSFGGHSITSLLMYRQSKLYDPTLAFLVPNGHQGAVGNIKYNYKDKYLAEISAGYEGTENFAPGNRFGLFPAYSIGWVPSEESFFPKNNIVNFVKIRASYGQVGNDLIGGARFLYNPTSYTYGTAQGNYFGQVGSTYQLYQGNVAGTVGNPGLTWERSSTLNGGIDVYMFNDALTLTADVFKIDRDNILEVPQTAPLITGYAAPAQNLGRMTNHGIDGEITYKNKVGNFNYQVSGNMSFARNKIIFESEVPQNYAYRNVTGQRYGQYYGLVATGYFNTWAQVNDPNRPSYYGNTKLQPGDVMYKDINGDGVINDDDMVPIGYSNIPEITYGFSFRGSYKGVDVSLLFQGVGNVSLQYTRRANAGFFDTPNSGALSYLDQSWTPERYAQGLPINFPRFSTQNGNTNYKSSTLNVVNASYLRLKNIEIGYSFTSRLLNRVGLKTSRIYVNANNLITWDNLLPGIDPENLPQGSNNQSYPLVRTINLGLNIGF